MSAGWRKTWAFYLVAAIVAAVIAGLVAVVVWLSLHSQASGGPQTGRFGLQVYRALFGQAETAGVVANTLVFATVTTLVSLIFGIPIAWLVARTDLPYKGWIRMGMTIGILIPSFATAMGWIFLLDPRVGMISRLLHTILGPAAPSFDLASIPGMGWVEGLALAPVGFIFTVGAFRNLDPSLEEAASTAGVGRWGVLRAVTLPMMAPAILAGAIYIFMIGFGAFDIPALIGLSNRTFTLSTLIYLEMQPNVGLPAYDKAAALGMMAVVLAVLFSVLYGWVVRLGFRYQSVSGSTFRPREMVLGRLRPYAMGFILLYFVLALALPTVITVWEALQRYVVPPSVAALNTVSLVNFAHMPLGLVGRGARNSAILVIATPTIALGLSGAMAWLVARTRSWVRFLIDATAYLPHAVPESVFAVGAMIAALFVLRTVVPIYGTVWLLLLVYVVVRVSLGVRVLTMAIMQLSPSLEEAVFVCGARFSTALSRITAPLLAPTALGLWLWMALLSFRDLTASSLLATASNLTLPVVVWSLWLNGEQTVAAAVSVLMLVVLTPLVLGFWRLIERQGVPML